MFSASETKRYAELDGVRGLAILSTIICNTAVVDWDGGTFSQLWSRFALANWIGVELFFVLSGFLITGILLDSKGEQDYFRNFYARRTLRIFPIYFAVLALISVWPEISRPAHHPLCYWLFVSNYCMAISGEWGDLPLGITWSLAVEEQFYLFWPLLVALLSFQRFAQVAVAVVAGSLLLRYAMTALDYSYVTIYAITPTRIDGLAAGALAAVAVRGKHSALMLAGVGKRMLALGVFMMGISALVVRSFNHNEPLVQTLGYTGLTLASTGLILALATEPEENSRWRRAMRWRPLAQVGFYSYAIYLFHPLVYKLLTALPAFGKDKIAAFPGGPLLGQVLATSLVTALAFVLAVVSYHAFEKHFLNLRRYFPRKAAPPVHA